MQAEIPLLEAVRSMDKEALVEIFDLYSSALFNYALRLCNDPLKADHIVGDVFAKLLDQCSTGNGPTTNLRSYLYETTADTGLLVDRARAAISEPHWVEATLQLLQGSFDNSQLSNLQFPKSRLHSLGIGSSRYRLGHDRDGCLPEGHLAAIGSSTLT